MSKIVNEVHQRLTKLPGRPQKFDPNIGLYRLRLPVPVVRRSVKPNYSFVSSCSESNLEAWNELWSISDLYEAKSQAIYFYQYKKINRDEFKIIAKWVSGCTCWEHSDDLSKIIANVTEDNPKLALPLLSKWVRSKKPWERRQSLVGLIEYSRKRKTFLPFDIYISNVNQLLDDEDYYVQKAVGWILREIYNVYPEKCLKFQTDNLVKISPIAYSAATEKLNVKDKQMLNALRKRLRSE